MDSAQVIAALTAFLERQGLGQVTITNARPMAGGATHETWSLDAQGTRPDGAAERLALVMRADATSNVGAMALDRAAEYGVLRAAFAAGVPVPEPLFLGDDSLGMPFFLMRRVEGETVARRLLRDERYAQARQMLSGQLAQALAQTHRIPLAQPDLPPLPAPPPDQSPAADELRRWERIYRANTPDPHPTFELAFRWCARHLPEVAERTLVHGDYRVGNVIFGPEGLRAVLDWELAHVGDPMEDIGWLCVRSWRFGADHLPIGGIGRREAFIQAYEAAGGQPVDRERMHFWEVFGNLKWGVITVMQMRSFLDGRSPSFELGANGRRTAETEWELLRLIGDG